MERNLKELINSMTLEEKAGMCSGLDFWRLKGVKEDLQKMLDKINSL